MLVVACGSARVSLGILGMMMRIGRSMRGRNIGPVIELRPRGQRRLADGNRIMPRRAAGSSLVQRVQAYLDSLPDDLVLNAIGGVALAMARELEAENSATSKSMCARALSESLADLRELAPADEEDDALDGLQADYSRRLRSVG